MLISELTALVSSLPVSNVSASPVADSTIFTDEVSPLFQSACISARSLLTAGTLQNKGASGCLSRPLVAAPAGVGVMGGWPGASSAGRGNRLPGGYPSPFLLSPFSCGSGSPLWV